MARGKEGLAMKSVGLFFGLIAIAGSFAVAAPAALAQGPSDNQAPAAVRITAACQLVEEATLVQEALDRFDSALATHDVQLLQAAGIEPGSARGWQRFFKSNPEARVTDRCPVTDLFIAGDTANWSCTETSTINSDGKPLQYARVIRFTFTKKNSEWMISDRR
jgi:hypothetical protein